MEHVYKLLASTNEEITLGDKVKVVDSSSLSYYDYSGKPKLFDTLSNTNIRIVDITFEVVETGNRNNIVHYVGVDIAAIQDVTIMYKEEKLRINSRHLKVI